MESWIHFYCSSPILHSTGRSKRCADGRRRPENIENILIFLKGLLPEIIVQAWGCGDDDPWEFWFKFDGDELVREDDEPFNDPEEDEEIKASIYAWWHQDLPVEIKEGFLNEETEE